MLESPTGSEDFLFTIGLILLASHFFTILVWYQLVQNGEQKRKLNEKMGRLIELTEKQSKRTPDDDDGEPSDDSSND